MPKTPPGLTFAGIAFALAALVAGATLEHTAAADLPAPDVDVRDVRAVPAAVPTDTALEIACVLPREV